MDSQRVAKELLRVAKELVSERHEHRTLRLSGSVYGEKVELRIFLRNSTTDFEAPDDQLWFGNASIVLDTGKMQPRLVRLIPHSYAHVKKAEAWKPFIDLAIAMGLI